MNIIQSPSPNFFGRAGYKPEIIVVHCTDGHWDSDKEWLRNPASQVSSHFIVSPVGEVHQLVSTDYGAWHAGRVDNPTARLLKRNPQIPGAYINPNFYSVGIEVSLRPPAAMPQTQKNSLNELIKFVAELYNIPLDRDHIIGHHEIYSLKTCPGTINVDSVVASLSTGPTPPIFVPLPNNAAIKEQIITLLNKIQ